MAESPRRYLRTRERDWPRAVARTLGNAGVRPNAVSLMSIVFAAIAGGALWQSTRGDKTSVLLVIAAAAIQLRLACNMFDGLLAVEGGFRSRLGDLYNEVPDRIADILILVGAGYAVRALPYGEALGWLAAVVAVMTAYVRLLAGSLGAKQSFMGPMAKQHRMFVISVGCIAAWLEYSAFGTVRALWIALVLVVVGSILTVARRLARLGAELERR